MTTIPTRTVCWSLPRRFVTAVAAAVGALVGAPLLVTLLDPAGPGEGPLVAGRLVAAAALAAATGALVLPGRRSWLISGAAGVAAVGLLRLGSAATWPAGLALPVVAAVAVAVARRLGERLPESVDRAWSTRRGVALLWALLSLVAVVQVGRLAAFMADARSDFALGTRNPFWYGHQCLSAYLHGAELAARDVENLYAAEHYPSLSRNAQPVTAVAGMTVEDAYQYPPQFLLLPAAALRLTHDYDVLRAGWFALNASLFVAAFAALALWAGGRTGGLSLWLLPAALASFPVLFDFQYGQFHLAALALALLAMLAFARRRPIGGGLLLAVAILAKLFPAVLAVPLLVQRRFRALAWTAAWGAALTVIALLTLGLAPFTAFLEYQLPRLADGSAFAFDEAWPEAATVLLVDNQGVFGLARKLGLAKPAAQLVGKLFGLGVLLLAALTAVRLRSASRWRQGAWWLGLLGLASLASPGAWGDYVPVAAIWLLALVASRATQNRAVAVGLGVTAVLQFFVLGTMPIGAWAPTAIMLPLSAIGVVSMVGLFGWGAIGRLEAREAGGTRPSPAWLDRASPTTR